MAEEDVEYESDPEEAKLSLKMRRRVASDDEEEGEEGGSRPDEPPRRIDESDGESEGTAAQYGEDELEGGEEGYGLNEEYLEEMEEEEEVEYEEDAGGGSRGDDLPAVAVGAVEEREEEAIEDVSGELMKEKKGVSNYASVSDDDENRNTGDGQYQEKRKEIEPFAVPTAGAFYMHDDRFRDNAVVRNRRTFGGRKLWESKDDRKWGHDKFEELTVQERHHEENRRGSRGRYRGRGRTRGAARGYAQRNRSKEYSSSNSTQHNSSQNASKSVRGRGPRRYQPSLNNEIPITQNNKSWKSVENHSHSSSGRSSQPLSNAESDAVLPRKQVASNLNVSSPPFYPTGSSTKDSTVPHNRDVQAGPLNRSNHQSVVDENFSISQSTGKVREKNIATSVGLHKLYIDDSPSAMSGKLSDPVFPPSSVSSSVSPTQPQFRGQGRGPNSFSQMAYQPAVSSSQSNKVHSPNQLQSIQRNSGQSRAQSSGQVSAHQFAQRLPSGSQAYSPPKSTGSVTAFKSEEMESTSVSSQMKTASNEKGKGCVQGNGKGSFLYGGSHVMGSSTGPGDHNFPAFLPVMQFGGQRPGGIGVPAVGMAFPGYVGQPQLGLGSSEMTWLPVLAGAAGALGPTYCPPYITVDGSYNARSSGQVPSTTATSSKETNSTKVGNNGKPDQKPDANNDSRQKQKNSRRYTGMKFDE